MDLQNAQHAVNMVAPLMAHEPPAAVETELRAWLAKRRAELPEPYFSQVVREISQGSSVVVIRP